MSPPRCRQIHLRILLCLSIVFGAAADSLTRSAAAEGRPADEAARIEALIDAVQRLADAAFIRNGHAYDSTTAAEFLRRKWQARATHVASAEDFIEKVASVSSTSGRPYVIRLKDGREIPCSAFLHNTLETIQLRRP
jgi:hypothetical protein